MTGRTKLPGPDLLLHELERVAEKLEGNLQALEKNTPEVCSHHCKKNHFFIHSEAWSLDYLVIYSMELACIYLEHSTLPLILLYFPQVHQKILGNTDHLISLKDNYKLNGKWHSRNTGRHSNMCHPWASTTMGEGWHSLIQRYIEPIAIDHIYTVIRLLNHSGQGTLGNKIPTSFCHRPLAQSNGT